MTAHLNVFDYLVLFAYLAATVALGFWVSRGGMKTSKDYFLGGRLYSGGLALESIFGFDFHYGLALFAITTAIYTVYGGLKSAAWTDFMQMVLLLVAGIVVPALALAHAGSLAPLVQTYPEKF